MTKVNLNDQAHGMLLQAKADAAKKGEKKTFSELIIERFESDA